MRILWNVNVELFDDDDVILPVARVAQWRLEKLHTLTVIHVRCRIERRAGSNTDSWSSADALIGMVVNIRGDQVGSRERTSSRYAFFLEENWSCPMASWGHGHVGSRLMNAESAKR